MGKRMGVLLIAAAFVVGLALGAVLGAVWLAEGIGSEDNIAGKGEDVGEADAERACNEARVKLLSGELDGGERLRLAASVDQVCETP